MKKPKFEKSLEQVREELAALLFQDNVKGYIHGKASCQGAVQLALKMADRFVLMAQQCREQKVGSVVGEQHNV